MAWLLPAAGIAAVVALVYYVTSSIRSYLHLRHIPGPRWAAWTDLWLVRGQLSGQLNFTLQSVNEKYGNLARIGRNWVVCGDPDELRRIWGVRSNYKRAYWYRGLRVDPYRDSTFSTLDDAVHDDLRSKLLPGYGGKDVDNLHENIDAQVAGFVKLLEDKYLSVEGVGEGESGNSDKAKNTGGKGIYKTVDLARKVQFFTLDVISVLAFGESFGYLDADFDKFGYIRTTESTVPILMSTAILPWIVDTLQSPYLRPFLPNVRGMVGIGTVMTLAREAVDARYGDHAVVKRDILGSFVAHGLGRDDAEGEAVVQIIAGSDTSATAIRSTLLYIITNPHVYTRLQREIDEGVRAGRISSPISDAEARNFPYLQAVIREGLRMWPPATGLLPKVSKVDDVICGYRVPAGTSVAWAPWTVMRNKAVFGDDCELFRPERWLGVAADHYRVMDQTVMLDFGGGSRYECLGKNIAMIELNKVYVELLRRFDIVLVDPAHPWKSFNAAFFIQSDMNVRITRRAEAVKE
ncbi:Cytochrome P450 family protein [Sporothrix brasiliensis 5110]|uniref:Cytochrome P450 family protein n=1 Tax=Sporothrix brasiliensis 5110 TaxID=1398154 RepID=A0A0C2J0E2_9PEZI|nr:Cytochrome P450 family protein [Sporothrix brasiliensis 5110]KIH92465.1 Cytochrome P450 family protein [Sporothrix brasiliensis 5110]